MEGSQLEHRRTRTYVDTRKANCVQCVGGHNLKTRPDVRRLFKDFRDVLYMVTVCTGMVNTATICMYRHGTYPGLPGNVPQIPYSLHMLTTLGRGLLGQGKGIVGQLGTLLSCKTLCSLS